MYVVGTILWALIGGTVVGFLGKWLAPGDRDVPLWLTILCGIGGTLVGSWLYALVFDCADMNDCTPGIDWWRHVWQIAVAALIVMAATLAVGRRGSAR